MAITIVPNTGKITKITAPTSSAPVPNAGVANFKPGSNMHCEGEVKLNGAAGDPLAGWQIGWIQSQWIETNWGNYRGETNSDGGMFLQRGRPPARAHQACRDTSGPVGDFFTDPSDPKEFQTLAAGTVFPVTVKVESNDPPGENYNLTEPNSKKANKLNYLQEVQLEFHFCTVLTVRDPAGKFHHQAHFYWNIHWQYRFHPRVFPTPGDGDWTITAVAGGNTAAASPAYSGAPHDRRFDSVLTTPQNKSCVDLAGISQNAVSLVGNLSRREFTEWTSVDVRK